MISTKIGGVKVWMDKAEEIYAIFFDGLFGDTLIDTAVDTDRAWEIFYHAQHDIANLRDPINKYRLPA